MWEALWSTHQRSTAGTRFYYIRQLMTSQVADESEAIIKHLLEMSRVAGRLRKLCPNGTIKIDDLEIVSLTASLPPSFSSVLSPFERQESARPKDAANAVRDELVTRRNFSNISVMANAVANQVESKYQNSSNSDKKEGKSKERQPRSKCDYCKNFHGGKCHKKEVDELEKKIEDLQTRTGKSQMAIEDPDGTNSDYSETMARSASNFDKVKPGRWNVDSGTTNSLVPVKHIFQLTQHPHCKQRYNESIQQGLSEIPRSRNVINSSSHHRWSG